MKIMFDGLESDAYISLHTSRSTRKFKGRAGGVFECLKLNFFKCLVDKISEFNYCSLKLSERDSEPSNKM